MLAELIDQRDIDRRLKSTIRSGSSAGGTHFQASNSASCRVKSIIDIVADEPHQKPLLALPPVAPAPRLPGDREGQIVVQPSGVSATISALSVPTSS